MSGRSLFKLHVDTQILALGVDPKPVILLRPLMSVNAATAF